MATGWHFIGSDGDGGNPPLQLAGDLIRKQSQNLQSHLGKIIRINDDGSLPKDNPFADSKIWSYGHRNIQGISFDPMLNESGQQNTEQKEGMN